MLRARFRTPGVQHGHGTYSAKTLRDFVIIQLVLGAFVHRVILCLPALCSLVKVFGRVFLTLPGQTVKERENLFTFRSGEMGYGDRLSNETKGNGRAGGPALLGAWEEAVSYLMLMGNSGQEFSQAGGPIPPGSCSFIQLGPCTLWPTWLWPG